MWPAVSHVHAEINEATERGCMARWRPSTCCDRQKRGTPGSLKFLRVMPCYLRAQRGLAAGVQGAFFWL